MRSSETVLGHAIRVVIRSACRRRLLVLALEQLAPALSVVWGGAILILLLGSQSLNWYGLLLLSIAGLGISTARIRHRMLTTYRVAQLLDRRLRLHDSLSTAWFLLSRSAQSNEPVSRIQIERAAELAASVKPSRAFPFTGRRGWAVTSTLAAFACCLFGVRYLTLSSLSLQQPLLPIHVPSMLERLEDSLSAESHQLRDAAAIHHQDSKSVSSAQAQKRDPDNLVAAQNTDRGTPGALSAGVRNELTNAPANEEKQNGNRDASPSSAESDRARAAGQPSGNQAASQQTPNTGGQQASNQETSSGLLDKMKDALSSLMAKMRPNSNSQKSPQNTELASGEESGRDQTGSTKDRDGKSQQSARSEQPGEQQSTEGQAQGQTTEKTQASLGRNSDQSPDGKGSDAHSGIGSQDGDKAIKEAEQLQALGKLAEIIGRRSANLTGEVSVETPSSNQQLRTEYSQKVGHHSDSGGEINRDEIPLIYQQYVREYMEQVRKQRGNTGPGD